MKILAVRPLAIPDVVVVRFARFRDPRGYFTESFRRSDFQQHPDLAFVGGQPFVQVNESYSQAGVVRGLHFQWNPAQGKLVRTVSGRMIDLVVDIRHGSPTLGKGVMHDLRASDDEDWCEWIWVPPGFAHGTVFPEASRIEYFCTAEYSPGCEGGITPVTDEIDWSGADGTARGLVEGIMARGPILSEKDRAGLSLAAWLADARSAAFTHPAAG